MLDDGRLVYLFVIGIRGLAVCMCCTSLYADAGEHCFSL